MRRFNSILLFVALFCVSCATQPNETQQRLDDLEYRVASLEKQAAVENRKSLVKDGKYTLQAGDTLRKISRLFGLSMVDLENLNPNVEWSKLRIGQQIVIEQ